MRYIKQSNSTKTQNSNNSMGYYMKITRDIKMTESFPGESINMEELLEEVSLPYD